ncbi:hypothetical protein [Microbacterium sp. NPDC057650]|uniref:hypothetical protein n=1 Tax=unclassified Microbacterium TaxID=2609290 RepID=UPI003670A498
MRAALVAIAVAAGALISAAPASAGSGIELFAAPDGRGMGCTAAAPCALPQAQARERIMLGAGKAVTVTLTPGRYDLADTLALTAKDSGTAGAPTVWRAQKPGTVVVSGGSRITGWQRAADRDGVWVADVPAGSESRQLYVDGEWAPIAQATTAELGFTAGWKGGSTGYSVTDAKAKSWLAGLGDPAGLEFVYDGKTGAWTQSRCLVEGLSVDDAAATVTMLPTCWDGMTKRPARAPIESGGLPNMSTSTIPTSVQNHPALLSAGEWYLDSDAGKLYYQPAESVDIDDLDITLPHLERVMTVAGSLADPVHDIRFEGLQFSYATWLSPSRTGFAEVQSNLHITGAPNQGKCTVTPTPGTCPYGALTQPLGNVDVSGSRDVAFVGNTFKALGGAGLSVRYGAAGTLIEGNHITDTSSTGLYLGCTFDPQPWDATTHDGIKQNCTPDPDLVAGDEIGENEIVRDTTVRNNVIHSVGLDYKAAPGVTLLFGQDLNLVHNEVFDTPYTGITGGIVQGHATDADNPENNQNANARNNISNNLIYNYMQYLRDGGAIYLESHQGRYIHKEDGSLDVAKTLENGMRATGNIAFNDRPDTNYTYYDDAGSQFIRWEGNVAMATSGASQGGCSPAGYLWTVRNWFSGQIGRYACSPPALAVTAEDNIVIPKKPTFADVPERVFTDAGLEPAYAGLSAVADEQLRYVSDRAADGRVVLGISGLTDDTKVYAGAQQLDVRRVGTTFAEVIVPDELAGRTITVGQPDPWVRVNETDPSVTASGWSAGTGRPYGDLNGDILFAKNNGSTVTITFTGTALRLYGEKNSDQGLVDVSIDGGAPASVDTYAGSRQANVVIFAADELAAGPHSVTITKRSGTYAVFDGYGFIPAS